MLECEIKLFEIDKEEIVRLLQRVGAMYQGTELLVDMYVQGSQDKKVRSRIRCTEKATTLTTKYKLPTTLTKQAYELDIPLPHDYCVGEEQWSDTIDHVRIKRRTSYSWGGYNFDIDEYRGVPPILEIEGPDEASIQKVILLLGLQKYPQGTCGGKGVYAYYKASCPTATSGFTGRLLSLIRCL